MLMMALCQGSVSARQNLDELSFEIKNAALVRTISNASGVLRTTKLEANHRSMLDTPNIEFMLDVNYKGDLVTLVASDFVIKATETEKIGPENRFSVELKCKKEGLPVVIFADYFYRADAPYQQKSIRVMPCTKAQGAILRRIVLDSFQLKKEFCSISPLDRFLSKKGDDPKADLTDTKTRFAYGQGSNYAAIEPKSGNGVFFFQGSLFGAEGVGPTGSLVMAEETYTPLSVGYRTGRATIGTATGGPELLHKRFREYLWDNYCVIRGKPMLVEYETWLNEKQHVSERKCLDEMGAMKREGYFNAFHLDYGWENHCPLTDDTTKFPRGLNYLGDQAKSMGLGMVYWINPLGSKGQTTDHPQWGGMWDQILAEHPDWTATFEPVKNAAPRGNDIMSFTTPYADFVGEKLLRLVRECNAAMFYIDGRDWSVFKSPAWGSYKVAEKETPFAVLNRYQSIYAKLHDANTNLIICLSPQVGNAPVNAHRLNTLDQIEFWDGTDRGCLGDRQQRYNQMFTYPPYTMNSGWYATDMGLPLPQVKYVILSGAAAFPQLQGMQQIVKPNADLSAYLKKFFAFRGRFGRYFESYQHVFDFPDGKSIDGEGHIKDNQGFILLFNPGEKAQKVAVPLNEIELELKGSLNLSDWTELDAPAFLASAKVGDRVEVELGPVSAKIIGVNLQ